MRGRGPHAQGLDLRQHLRACRLVAVALLALDGALELIGGDEPDVEKDLAEPLRPTLRRQQMLPHDHGLDLRALQHPVLDQVLAERSHAIPPSERTTSCKRLLGPHEGPGRRPRSVTVCDLARVPAGSVHICKACRAVLRRGREATVYDSPHMGPIVGQPRWRSEGHRYLQERSFRPWGPGTDRPSVGAVARQHGTARQPTEDGIIFVVLVLTLGFLIFMMSVPMWFSSVVRGLTG